MKKITINVDDLGLSPAVNEAVIHLAKQKRIHSTSFMSLGQIDHQDVITLNACNIDIGLHFDLTEFGQQGTLKQVLMQSLFHRGSNTQIKQHIERQLDAFEEKIGQVPVFVDGHQHVHQFPQIQKVLLTTLEQRYGKKILLRSTKPIQKDFKSYLIYLLGGFRFNQMIQQKNWQSNTNFGGIYGFDANENILEKLWNQWLDQASTQGTVLMCHPAVPNNTWQDSIKTAREREYAWLSSERFGELWEKHDCRPQFWHDFVKA